MVAPRRRIAIVDLLRTASILAVLAVHLGASGLLVDGPGFGAFQRFARNGTHGVTVFFVVSGFVITETILRWTPDPRHLSLRWFYVKRIGRLAPLAAAVLVLGVLAVKASEPSPARAFVLREPDAVFNGWLAASFPTLSFNWARAIHESHAFGFGLHWDVFWSLAIEEQFYLLFPPLLRRLGVSRRLVAVLAVMAVLGPLWRWAMATMHPTSLLWVITTSPAAMDQLAIGALACLVSRRLGPGWWAAPAAGLGAAVVAVTWTATYLAGSPAERIWPQTAIALGIGLVIVGGMRLRVLDRAPSALTTPGQLCYGMYLLHGVVLFAMWDVLEGNGPWPALALYVLAVLAVAAPVFRFVEQPANAWIRQRFAGSARRPGAEGPPRRSTADDLAGLQA